jgi:hypothetical protein
MWFERNHREDWRLKMKEGESLIAYFQTVEINIEILKKSKRYGYRLRGKEARMDYGFKFSCREVAVFDSLEIAFRLHQQIILRKLASRRKFEAERKQQNPDRVRVKRG